MAVNNSEDRSSMLPSIRQKQILDIAADNPDASMEDLADEIPSATTDLVERILEVYGDPGKGEPEIVQDTGNSATDESAIPDLEDLSQNQSEVLRAIFEHPTASQRELADMLGVSGPTVCNRANSIVGFNWEDRQTFVEAMFDSEPDSPTEEPLLMASNGTESTAPIEQLTNRVTSIEQQLSDLTTAEENDSLQAFADPELVHKVAHACLKSEEITEDEELQILKAFLQ